MKCDTWWVRELNFLHWVLGVSLNTGTPLLVRRRSSENAETTSLQVSRLQESSADTVAEEPFSRGVGVG